MLITTTSTTSTYSATTTTTTTYSATTITMLTTYPTLHVYSFPYGFSYLALLTTILFVLHACMHLWNLYEVPAYESGLINTLNPRVGLGSLVDPTITQHHHQQHQQFQTNNQNRIETPSSSSSSSSSSSQQSSTSQSFVPSSLFQPKSRIRSFSHNVSHTNHHNHQHHTTPSSPSSSSSSSSSVSKQQSHSLNHLHSTASLSPSSSTAVTIPSKIPYRDNYNHNNYNQNLPSIFPSLPHLPLKQHQHQHQQQQLSGQLQPKQQSLYIKRLVIQFMFSFVVID